MRMRKNTFEEVLVNHIYNAKVKKEILKAKKNYKGRICSAYMKKNNLQSQFSGFQRQS